MEKRTGLMFIEFENISDDEREELIQKFYLENTNKIKKVNFYEFAEEQIYDDVKKVVTDFLEE